MHKYGVITVLSFSKYASPVFAQRKPNGKLRLPVFFREVNIVIAGEHTNNIHPVSTLADTEKHLAEKSFSGSLIALKLIAVCRRRTNSQWKRLNSFFVTELLPREDLNKVLADLWLLF